MIETLQTLSIVCFVLAGVCFVLAVILFIVFRIPSLIGFLTGRSARREIEEIEQNSAYTGNIGTRMGQEIKSRGVHTGQFTHSGSFRTNSRKLHEEAARAATSPPGSSAQTAPGYDGSDGRAQGYGAGNAAVPGSDSEGTSVLNYGAEGTTVLNYGSEGTSVLNYDGEGTAIPDPNRTQPIAGNTQGYTTEAAAYTPSTEQTQPITSNAGSAGETMVLGSAYGQPQNASPEAGGTPGLNPKYESKTNGPGDTMVLNSAYAQELLMGMKKEPAKTIQRPVMEFHIDYELGFTSSTELIEIEQQSC